MASLQPPQLLQVDRSFNNNALKEKVELFISCKDVIKKDINSKSDPFVVVYMKGIGGKYNKFGEIGRTEVIHDNHFPNFTKQFRLDYYFEQEQVLRFDVFDEDKLGSPNLKDHDVLGSCTMKLGEIIHEENCILGKRLMYKGKYLKNKKTKKYTSLYVTADKVNTSGNKIITMKFSCKKLPRMDGLFGKCDPYFMIERLRSSQDDDKRIRVYGNRANFIKRTYNPSWPSFKIESQTLCNNDEWGKIVISIYDWDDDGGDDYVGSVVTNLNELKTRPKKMQIKKLGSKKKKNKTYGEFNVDFYEEGAPLYSFLDFMQGRLDMGLMAAIDFTGSNGDPRDYQSLHHFTNTKPSCYQTAIRQIGNILSVYDTDKRYPVWGFGANFGNVLINGQYWNGTKHDFNLNFSATDPEVQGVIGIENAYVSALKNNTFALSGPTLFQPILKKAKALANMAHNDYMKDTVNKALQYYILLIITDGIITDMKMAKNEIVDIANKYLPLSIIIVGVGNANFSGMNELDGDDGNLSNSQGVVAKRDIVQFVPMNKFQGNISGLSSEVLKEIPAQFLSYTRHFKLKPGKRVPIKEVNVASSFEMTESEDKKDDDDDGLIQPTQTILNTDNSYWDTVPLPNGWERAYDEEGRTYYVDNINQKTQWKHPNFSA